MLFLQRRSAPTHVLLYRLPPRPPPAYAPLLHFATTRPARISPATMDRPGLKPSASTGSHRELHRIYSHLDDHSVCHDHHPEVQTSMWKAAASTESLSSRSAVEKELGEMPRASDDSRGSRDLEQGPSLEKSRTPGAACGPNVVSPLPRSPFPRLAAYLPPVPCLFALLTSWYFAGYVGRPR